MRRTSAPWYVVEHSGLEDMAIRSAVVLDLKFAIVSKKTTIIDLGRFHIKKTLLIENE